MRAFRVRVNRNRSVTAGLPGKHVVTAILTSVERTDRVMKSAPRRITRRVLDFDLGGLVSREDEGPVESVQWLRRRLRVGDKIVIEVVDVEKADPPKRRMRYKKARSAKRQGPGSRG